MELCTKIGAIENIIKNVTRNYNGLLLESFMKEKVIDIERSFNWQVQKAQHTNSYFLIDQAKLNRELYLISKDLTIEDWRIIRSGDYYQIRDQLSGNKQMEFIIERIRYYL